MSLKDRFDFLSDPTAMFGIGVQPRTNVHWLDLISRMLTVLGIGQQWGQTVYEPTGTVIVWNIWLYNNLHKTTLEAIRYDGDAVIRTTEVDILVSDPRVVTCGYVVG